MSAWLTCLSAIIWRELLRFLQQRERFLAALVRPLLWLFIFATGLRSVFDLALTGPDGVPIAYEAYVVPGLCAMIQLFNGMQSSLSMVLDRETGTMRVLLISPFPRAFLLGGKLIASTAVSLVQVYLFLVIAWLWGVEPPLGGFLMVLPALVLSGLALGAIGLLLSSVVRQLENFAGVMNFVIFPTFFASSALYPLARLLEESPALAWVAIANPFTHCVELIRHALALRLDVLALCIVTAVFVAVFYTAVRAYDPMRRIGRSAA